MLDATEVYNVQVNMQKYGGSFVSALGNALMRADTLNQQKIKDAFPRYWKQYLNIGDKK